MSDLESALAKAMLKSVLEGDDNEPKTRRPPATEARRLLDLYNDLTHKHQFRPGDLVSWKRGLKNGKYPLKGYPAIVTKVYEQAIIREDMESGSNHFREPLDMVIMVDTDDEISEFHVDSRRFEPYQGEIELSD